MTTNRYLTSFIANDLRKKMVFLAGPRQVGKTTLAKDIAQHCPPFLYFSWDRAQDRRQLLQAQWPAEPTTIILDELHKYRRWKRWIKGEYDGHRERHRFLVTGSARMDVYRRGGDSLQGRYHHYRLHPFTYSELSGHMPPIEIAKALIPTATADRAIVNALLQWSGFPEPILAHSTTTHRRWQKERVERFLREDVRDLENVRDLSSLQILTGLLPERVASLLSLNAVREDLEVSHRAITHWMDILDRLYFTFRIRPFHRRQPASLKKSAKLYLWDWSLVPDRGARYENFIAAHLLKFCHFLEDTAGYTAELFYLRDIDQREVDFLVTLQRRPWFAVEAKLTDHQPAAALRYFGERLAIPYCYQVVLEGDRDVMADRIRILPAAKFLSALP